MLSFSAPYWRRRRRDAAIESHYRDEKIPRKLSKFLQTLKSCCGHGSIKVDIPSRNEYQRASDPAIDFEGKEVYGIQAEYLDNDDMAWGKQAGRRDHGLYARSFY